MKYLLLGLALVLLFLLLRRRQTSVESAVPGFSGMVGMTGTAEQTFTTEGTISVNGEIWKATSKRGIVHKGDRVRVVTLRDGLVLEVEPVTSRI